MASTQLAPFFRFYPIWSPSELRAWWRKHRLTVYRPPERSGLDASNFDQIAFIFVVLNRFTRQHYVRRSDREQLLANNDAESGSAFKMFGSTSYCGILRNDRQPIPDIFRGSDLAGYPQLHQPRSLTRFLLSLWLAPRLLANGRNAKNGSCGFPRAQHCQRSCCRYCRFDRPHCRY